MDLARYTPNGQADETFGSAGRVVTRIGFPDTKNTGTVTAIAIDREGRTVVGGYAADVVGGYHGGFVARFLPDGTLDSSFGSGGVATALPNGGIAAIAIDREGEIVAAGYAHSARRPQFAVARFDGSGSLDPDFGTGGAATMGWHKYSTGRALALAIAPSGKIVVAGEADFKHSGHQFTLLRYLHDGTLDRSFGSKGVVRTRFPHARHGFAGDYPSDVAVGALGRITVAGSSFTGGRSCFAIARYQANGSPDPDFGVHGKARTSIGRSSEASALLSQPHHRAVLAGYAVKRGQHDPTLALARYFTGAIRH